MDVSVIICTRNRAAHLRETLRSLAATHVPSELEVELIVVDNASTDETTSVVDAADSIGEAVRRVVESRPGLSRARNRGVLASTGHVLLFTDDDVRVPYEWIGPMTVPILQDKADAVAGGVRLADPLRRDWMTPRHTMLLADTEILRISGGERLVGANMAVHRSVFDVVPEFDPALGAGHLGFHEETLFWLQCQQAGFRLARVLDVAVRHYPEVDRLLYTAFADTMRKQGESDAYLDHHWRHASGPQARHLLALAVWTTRLAPYRLLPWRRRARTTEGMALWEMRVRRRIAYHRQMLRYCGTPRRYERLSHTRKGTELNLDDQPRPERRPSTSERPLQEA